MSLGNLRIGSRLGLGFGAILLITTIAIVATVVSLKQVTDNAMRAAEESIPFALLADEMVVNTIQVQQFTTRHSISISNLNLGNNTSSSSEVSRMLGLQK